MPGFASYQSEKAFATESGTTESLVYLWDRKPGLNLVLGGLDFPIPPLEPTEGLFFRRSRYFVDNVILYY